MQTRASESIAIAHRADKQHRRTIHCRSLPLFCDIRESAISIVSIERIPPKLETSRAGVSIIVVISRSHAHPVQEPRMPAFSATSVNVPSRIITIRAVPKPWIGLIRDAPLGIDLRLLRVNEETNLIAHHCRNRTSPRPRPLIRADTFDLCDWTDVENEPPDFELTSMKVGSDLVLAVWIAIGPRHILRDSTQNFGDPSSIGNCLVFPRRHGVRWLNFAYFSANSAFPRRV